MNFVRWVNERVEFSANGSSKEYYNTRRVINSFVRIHSRRETTQKSV